MKRLRLIQDPFPEDPALDVAISRALMERVAADELPDTLRLGRPSAWVAFGKRDAISPAYPGAVARAREAGFGAALRLAGGRAAVFHEGTLAIAHAVGEKDARSGVHDRFRDTADLLTGALRDLGVDARVGEVPGEYCPGGYSVNAGGRTKLAGIGQRLIRGGAHLGGVLVVSGADRVREALTPVYEELDFDWNPDTADLVTQALRALGVDARVGEVPGEYCPGGYSVNARGQTKLAGIGQRLIRGGAHIGGVIVVSGADRVKAALTPVYEELGLDWSPDTAGAIEDEIALNWEAAMAAIKAGYEERYEVEEAALDEDTLDLAHRLKPEHEAEG